MKLCTSCQINSFMKFKHQVYPKCVQSQCEDVNDKNIEADDGASCLAGNNNLVEATEDDMYCNKWYYSCEGPLYTKMGARTGYLMLDGDSVKYSFNEADHDKFDIVQRGNKFLIKTKTGKCLEVNNMSLLSAVACESSSVLQEFSWAD